MGVIPDIYLELSILHHLVFDVAFPGSLDDKESACNAGDPGSILGREDTLEKGTATHSSILAWRIPWTEEPGEQLSMGLQRVRHTLVSDQYSLSL